MYVWEPLTTADSTSNVTTANMSTADLLGLGLGLALGLGLGSYSK